MFGALYVGTLCVCVCVCVFVCVSERERVCVCMSERQEDNTCSLKVLIFEWDHCALRYLCNTGILTVTFGNQPKLFGDSL